jgi:TonB family protein
LSSFSYRQIYNRIILPTTLILFAFACASAQSSVVTANAMDPDAVQHRIERARALAAAHQLGAAASELESLRASVRDAALRNITSLMLMGIYLEDANYVRAQAILEETFQARSAQKDDSVRTFFALAGQAINGVRSHVARYRSFGINTSGGDLPPEAQTDLDRVRSLLERMAAQAKEITKETPHAYDALALQEDVLGLRMSLARDNDDRDKWQTEYAAAREHLATSQIQVASLGRPPALAVVTSKIPNPFSPQKPAEQSDSVTATKTEGVPPPPPSIENQPATVPTPQTAATQPSSDSAGAAIPAQPNGPDQKLISTGSLSGRENKRVTAVYPVAAKANGSAGLVRVFIIVDENGKVWVTSSEGPMLLRKAAEDAARAWSFPPPVAGGKPVRLAGYLDFDFKP